MEVAKILPLSKQMSRIEKQLEKLAYEICEVDFDMNLHSTKNKKYAKLRQELCELEKQKQDLCRTFSAHWY